MVSQLSPGPENNLFLSSLEALVKSEGTKTEVGTDTAPHTDWLRESKQKIRDRYMQRVQSRLESMEVHLRDQQYAIDDQAQLTSLLPGMTEISKDRIDAPQTRAISFQPIINQIKARRRDVERLAEQSEKKIEQMLLSLHSQLMSATKDEAYISEEWGKILTRILLPEIDAEIEAIKQKAAQIMKQRQQVQKTLATVLERLVEDSIQDIEGQVRALNKPGEASSSKPREPTAPKRPLNDSSSEDVVAKRPKSMDDPRPHAEVPPTVYIIYPRYNAVTIRKLLQAHAVCLRDYEIQKLEGAKNAILLLLNQEDGYFLGSISIMTTATTFADIEPFGLHHAQRTFFKIKEKHAGKKPTHCRHFLTHNLTPTTMQKIDDQTGGKIYQAIGHD